VHVCPERSISPRKSGCLPSADVCLRPRFNYPAEALKAVYFGPNIDRLALDIVCVILAGQNPDVEFWVGRRSDREFKVEFEQKTYTPYIVAKRLEIV
jgi:hypothetical protein